jgi:hypothetical protein
MGNTVSKVNKTCSFDSIPKSATNAPSSPSNKKVSRIFGKSMESDASRICFIQRQLRCEGGNFEVINPDLALKVLRRVNNIEDRKGLANVLFLFNSKSDCSILDGLRKTGLITPESESELDEQKVQFDNMQF